MQSFTCAKELINETASFLPTYVDPDAGCFGGPVTGRAGAMAKHGLGCATLMVGNPCSWRCRHLRLQYKCAAATLMLQTGCCSGL